MTDQRDIRNSGIFIGGNNSHSPITMSRTGPADGLDEAEVLRQFDALFTRLATEVVRLPAEQAGMAAYRAAQLQAEVTAANRDPGRVQSVLGALKAAAATAAPLAGIVKDMAELLTNLH